jgi:hypothetical protein
LAEKAFLALGVSWHSFPNGRKGMGWTGKPLSGDLLSFGGLFIQFQKVIPKPKTNTIWKLAGLSPLPVWGEGFTKFLLQLPFISLEGNQRRLFRKPVFIHGEHIMSYIYMLKRQDKHLWLQLRTN